MSADGPTPSETLAVIIYLTREDFLVSDPHRFHGAIRIAQPVCSLLNVFTFAPTTPNPTSRVLDDALGLLKLARIVRMENTDYERYIVDADARQYIETVILPRFSEQRDELEQAAAILREACGVRQLAFSS